MKINDIDLIAFILFLYCISFVAVIYGIFLIYQFISEKKNFKNNNARKIKNNSNKSENSNKNY